MNGKRFVLLDRDGTVISEKNYLSDPAEVELLPGVAEGLRQLAEHGYELVLITNQSGVGRGMFGMDAVNRVHERLTEILAAAQIRLAGIYICPHAPADNCECRKPKPKLALAAARDLEFDLKTAWMIGDKPADAGLARNTGMRSILVLTGYGAEGREEAQADFTAHDLTEAAAIILREDARRKPV